MRPARPRSIVNRPPAIRSDLDAQVTLERPEFTLGTSPKVTSIARPGSASTDRAPHGHRMGTGARKRRSPLKAGFASACQHSRFLVAAGLQRASEADPDPVAKARGTGMKPTPVGTEYHPSNKATSPLPKGP